MKLKRTEVLVRQSKFDERKEVILELKSKGWTNIAVGKHLGISRERVRQLLLPTKKLKINVFVCPKCSNEQKSFRKTAPLCLECLSEKRQKRNKKLQVLNDIFKGLPEWKQQGRERTREIVRYRDNHTCQSCGHKWGKGERSLDVHHLGGLCGKKSLGYDSVKDLDTLITLCHKCHFNHPEHTLHNKSK